MSYAYEESPGTTSGRLVSYPTFGSRIETVTTGSGSIERLVGPDVKRLCQERIGGEDGQPVSFCRSVLDRRYVNPEASVALASGTHLSYNVIVTDYPNSRGSTSREYRPRRCGRARRRRQLRTTCPTSVHHVPRAGGTYSWRGSSTNRVTS